MIIIQLFLIPSILLDIIVAEVKPYANGIRFNKAKTTNLYLFSLSNMLITSLTIHLFSFLFLVLFLLKLNLENKYLFSFLLAKSVAKILKSEIDSANTNKITLFISESLVKIINPSAEKKMLIHFNQSINPENQFISPPICLLKIYLVY